MARELTKEELESYWIRESQIKNFIKEYKKEIERVSKEKKELLNYFERLLHVRKVKTGGDTFVILKENEMDTLLREMNWLDRRKQGLMF